MKFNNSYVKQVIRFLGFSSREEANTVYEPAAGLFRELVATKKVPGLAVTVLKKGKVIFDQGYGFANIKDQIPVDPQNTLFRIASVSKPIVASALAVMVSEGKISLDRSFYTYVPYYPKKKWDFTLRQLASHTAGIRSYRGKEFALNEPYSIKEGIAIFKDSDLLFEPGTAYNYTSYGWVLIALAMQEVSGVPFEDYVEDTILNPLKLTNIYAPCAHKEAIVGSLWRSSNLATSKTSYYTKSGGGFRVATPINKFYKLAGGGYLGTSSDVARFGQAIVDHEFLSESSNENFITSSIIKNIPTYYGLGWQVSKDAYGRSYYGHVGSGIGGYANFFVYPKEQLVFSILINCTDPKVQETLDKAIDLFIKVKNS